RGSQARICLEDRCHYTVLHLRIIAKRRVEPALTLPFLIRQLEHRSVMSVRPGNHRIFDPCSVLDSLANVLKGPFSRGPPKIESDDGDLPVSGLDDQSHRIERIERSDRESIVPRSVSPHGQRFMRSYITARRPGLEFAGRVLGQRAARENDEDEKKRCEYSATMASKIHFRIHSSLFRVNRAADTYTNKNERLPKGEWTVLAFRSQASDSSAFANDANWDLRSIAAGFPSKVTYIKGTDNCLNLWNSFAY